MCIVLKIILKILKYLKGNLVTIFKTKIHPVPRSKHTCSRCVTFVYYFKDYSENTEVAQWKSGYDFQNENTSRTAQ
jgi:hypothetical protein